MHRYDPRQQRWVNDKAPGLAADRRHRRREFTVIRVSAGVLVACLLGFGLHQLPEDTLGVEKKTHHEKNGSDRGSNTSSR